MPILLVALLRNENIPLTFDEIVNRGMCRFVYIIVMVGLFSVGM